MTALTQKEGGPGPRGRRRFLLTTAALALTTALFLTLAAGGSATLASSSDSSRGSSEAIAGSWLETISSTDGSFPAFQVLITYDTGGGLVATASIDAMSGLKSSPTHGAWRRDKERGFAWVGHAFSFDDSGNPNGYYNIKESETISTDGKGFSGSGTFEVVGGPGAVPLTRYTVTAIRIVN